MKRRRKDHTTLILATCFFIAAAGFIFILFVNLHGGLHPDNNKNNENPTGAADITGSRQETGNNGEAGDAGENGQNGGAGNNGGAGDPNGKGGQKNENEREPASEIKTGADEIMKKMTLREKIYQMCIITPEQLGGKDSENNEWSRWPVTQVDERAGAALAKYPVGGIIFFEGNLKSPDQTRKMLSGLQDYASQNGLVPLFLCIDEEGGKVARIANNPGFDVPKTGPMKNIKNAAEALEAGRTIGRYLSGLGFNVDFAPDADVLTAAGSVIIGNRSFGSDPLTVTEFASAVSDGLHEFGIMSCFKHFPGHGAVEADTHVGLAYTDKTLADLMECEMIPFAKAKEKGIDMIMAAHISLPTVLGDNTPCSLSEYLLTDILKKSLGYDGLVITDALNMGAIAKICDNGTAAVQAVKAGADILLMPPDLEEAVSAVEEAVKSGTIPEQRIDDAVRKILEKKLALKKQDKT